MIQHLLALKGCFGYLAVAGGIVMFFSRRSIRRTAIESSDYWVRAFRIIPCAEMFFATSHWERPHMKTSTALWCAGFLCCIPFALVKLESYEQEGTLKQSGGEMPSAERLPVGGENVDFVEVLRAWQRQERLDELNGLLMGWYKQMSARRAGLTGAAAAAVETFNLEAAAYSDLLKLVSEERAELAVLRTRFGEAFPPSGSASASN